MVIVAGISVFAQAQTARESDASEPATPAPVVPTDAAEFPAVPEIKLASPPAEYADEHTYRSLVTARADALAEQAATSDDPLIRAERLLAAANLDLSFRVEPACSRTFLDLPPEPSSDETGTPSAILERAAERIGQAIAALRTAESTPAPQAGEAAPGDEPDAAAPQPNLAAKRSSLLSRANTLRAFCNAEAVFLAEHGEGAADADRSRGAASDLAPILEDEDRMVAYAALFWQSLLRSGEPDPEAVLARLEYVSAEPSRGTEPYAFLGRLLRCRVLAERRPKPVALALLLQLEERCFDWFENPAERQAALRTVALIRLQVLRAWYDSLDAESAPDERAWCVSRAQKVISDSFGDDATTVIRLLPPVPIVVSATDAVSTPDRPADGR